VGQCVNWGVLYYAFAVLVVPLERELGAPTWAVTGAFSLALLVSAVAAPAVGRWADRDQGPLVMQAGGWAAGVLLLSWVFLPGIAALYVVWAALGLCMAAILYEPAFVIIGRAHEDATARLRALALLTVFGGLASSVFLPTTAFLVGSMGWRRSIAVLALLLMVSTAVTHVVVFRHMKAPRGRRPAAQAETSRDVETTPAGFAFIASTFALVSLSSAAFAANLVPTFGERGVSAAHAALLGGLIGVMQLPGRVLLMSGAFAAAPTRLLAVSLGLEAVGFASIALAPSVIVIAAGTMFFALGAGLTTLVRPQLVQALFGVGRGGLLNGRIARYQQLARAAGPLTLAWVGGRLGYATALLLIATAFGACALLSRTLLGRGRDLAVGTGPAPRLE
jgi:MFS family permease